jgi:hypothetical protein
MVAPRDEAIYGRDLFGQTGLQKVIELTNGNGTALRCLCEGLLLRAF